MTRLTVLTGGSTPERDVALAGAAQVVQALRGRGHVVSVVDTVTGPVRPGDEERLLHPDVGREPPTRLELETLASQEDPHALLDLSEIREADLVFLVLHGKQGEGGELQALLDLAGITYTGSGPFGSALAMDKDVTKRLFRQAGIATPQWHMWPLSVQDVAFAYPVVVKPSKTGSTVGVTLVDSGAGLPEAVELALQFDDEVMIEEYIAGREFTVGILGDQALGAGEIIPQHTLFDYECKYTPGMTDELFPAPVADELADDMRRLALEAHRTLKLRDFSRVDFRMDEQSTLYCLEVNTLPGLTSASLLPQSAAVVGIDFPDLCESICREALKRAGDRRSIGS